MTRALLITLPAIALGLGLLYAVAATNYTIDCGNVERTLCEQTWADIKDELQSNVPEWIPTTGVTVDAADPTNPACATWTIHKFGLFDMTYYRDCFSP
jgi:hypothetical protein